MTLEKHITQAWDEKQSGKPLSSQAHQAVHETMKALNQGKIRVATPSEEWQVHEWVKKAILLFFSFSSNQWMKGGEGALGVPSFYDKVPLKTASWTEKDFQQAGFRSVPGSIVRYGSYVESGAILMPSFINIGAWVGEGTLVDTWSTIGSCAQIGRRCHISGGVGIGGVLEPLQAAPVIIEDDCFIGARSEIAEGVIVEKGAVIAMGTFIGSSTKIVDRVTGEITYGRVPAYSVVVPGTLPPSTGSGPHLNCAVIVKRVDERTRSKTALNELLRL